MAAVLGLDTEALAGICMRRPDRSLVIANDNCPARSYLWRQPTLGALPSSRGSSASSAGGQRGFTPLMEHHRTSPALEATPSAPRLPVIGNVHAAPLESAEAIRAGGAQLTSTVRWASLSRRCARGIETFVELGPKDAVSLVSH